jgi:hypothetical protein
MAHHGEDHGYGRKGAFFLRFLLFFALFIIMLIWIYNKNQQGLN